MNAILHPILQMMRSSVFLSACIALGCAKETENSTFETELITDAQATHFTVVGGQVFYAAPGEQCAGSTLTSALYQTGTGVDERIASSQCRLSSISSIKTDGSNVYLFDTSENTFWQYAPHSNKLETLAQINTTISANDWIVYNGIIYYASQGLYQFNPNTHETTLLHASAEGPVAADDTYVFATSHQNIVRVDSSGSSWIIGAPTTPIHSMFSDNEFLYFGDEQGMIARLDRTPPPELLRTQVLVESLEEATDLILENQCAYWISSAEAISSIHQFCIETGEDITLFTANGSITNLHIDQDQLYWIDASGIRQMTLP